MRSAELLPPFWESVGWATRQPGTTESARRGNMNMRLFAPGARLYVGAEAGCGLGEG